MSKLTTPFGDIKILVDGTSIPYNVEKGSGNDALWPDVHNRFQITVQFVPDGVEHIISCVFVPNCLYKKAPESGEQLECQSFYNSKRFKMSIGLKCEAGYIGGQKVSDGYDYDIEYLDNGMSYLILSSTKTNQYVFGIAWIDDVGWNDPINDNNRDVQTWFAADPTLSL